MCFDLLGFMCIGVKVVCGFCVVFVLLGGVIKVMVGEICMLIFVEWKVELELMVVVVCYCECMMKGGMLILVLL